ncbi:hypothetical protein C8C85_2445 [Flavobacterium sp. 103]|nr:hypothetical protein C8C85_2445 [Flavobacterium sp. 103]
MVDFLFAPTLKGAENGELRLQNYLFTPALKGA